MNVRNTLLFCSILMASAAQAQSDVTKYYMTNYGFDSNFNYPATSSANVTQEINTIEGWTPDLSADYTITGVYEFGFKGKYNGATVPATGYDGEAGGGLALSTGWEQTFCYTQEITLPKGTYTIKVPTYNGKSVTAGISQLAWIPSSGTEVKSTLSSYPAKKWTVDEITFTLTKQTKGKIQIGYKAGANGSVNSANLLIDYVQIIGENMTVNRSIIKTAINTANRYYSEDGVGAEELKKVIDEAQAVYDKGQANLTAAEILEAAYLVNQATAEYRKNNASESSPIEYTSTYINNPSFETNGTENWTVSNMSTQTNSVFNSKSGTTYMETWVNIGSKIGNAGISQTIKKLPKGNYKLSAAGLHIQQSASQSTTNKGTAQTGAYIYAGNARTTVTNKKTYEVKFSVFDDENDIEIGLGAEDATGNWLCVDNFRLYYTGAITTDSYVNEVNNLISRAEELSTSPIQNTVRETLEQALTQAKESVKGTDDGEGNITYDKDALIAARTTMISALSAAKTSTALYTTLEARISYAQKVLGWWEDNTRKQTAVNNLKTALATAQEKAADYTLTDSELTTATNTLNTKIKAVDKKIYSSSNACGSESELQNTSSYWSYERSMQSKHWILFWEEGYGKTTPQNVETILNNADKIFEFYADSLKYITINQGKSKTDTYKMIIRLRHSTTWEASGSGIDNTIGLLTLSNGAHTSRSGQTVGHEIGHCFQYQTHCDNGDSNGWMYNWSNSANGNVFWEMCAQWQAYKFYPEMQFNNEWLTNTLNGFHKNPLAEELRYNNYFIQDFFCHKHGIDALSRLWNESKNPEDPFQAYMRIFMDSKLTSAQKLEQFNEEMWEYGARLTTFDMDGIRDRGAGTIGKRTQTKLTQDSEGYWCSQTDDCIENFGNNAIRLNAPTTGKTLYAELTGEAGKDDFISYNVTKAGWKFGFVGLRKDGTRVYGDVCTTNYSSPSGTVSFDCPDDCTYLWLVVSGAPTSYWSRGWNGTTADDEQWPYKVKFYQTNLYGQTNNDEVPSGIVTVKTNTDSVPQHNNVYSISGQVVRHGTTSTAGLPQGIYIVNGKKVVVK